ncbi:hypothetical protein V492_04249 [Pseudogymnoascus sp. VKM F-4246]|nr:hypothetical protein V492_04249 [Pseudogymnoascus sp. VKM F-4246]
MENTLEPPGGSKYGDNPPQYILDAMMEELGIGRINDLSLENNPKDKRNANIAVAPALAKPPTKEIKKITSKYGNEINMWKSFKPDDVDQDALLLDDLGSGQSHRLRMQAALAGSSTQGGHDLRGSRGGYSGGSHTGGSSRGGGYSGQSNKRNRVPIEEIANLLRFSDPMSVIRGGRGGSRGYGVNNGRVGSTHGHSTQASNNIQQAQNVSSGHTTQQTTTPRKSPHKKPPQPRSVQRNSSPILSLATPDSFFTNARRVENTQPRPAVGQAPIRQPGTRQATTKQPAIGQTTTRQPAAGKPAIKPQGTKPPVTKPSVSKQPIAEPPIIGQPTIKEMAPISKADKLSHIKPTPEVPLNNVPSNTRATPSGAKDEDLISFDLISLEDNDSWVSSSTETMAERLPSGYMQDMWALEEDASALFNMIVEATRKGMAKEKQERAHLLDSLANGVIPDGRGISSSVYASDEPPVTKESVNKYWSTKGPSFQKGLENDSIRLILEGAAAEIVRLDAPTSSDLGQQDVSGNVSEADQSNSEECVGQVVSENVTEGPQPNPAIGIKQINQVDNLECVIGEPHSVSEPVESASGGEEAGEGANKPKTTHLQYDASELLKLRPRALTVDKSAFPDEIRQFVVKDTNELSQKPVTKIKVLGGLADSKWASPSKTNDENVTLRKVNPSARKVNPAPSKVSTTPSKVDFDPSKASFVPSSITQHGSAGSGASNLISEKTQPSKAVNGLAASEWADEPKQSDTYTPLDFVSAISSATVPARPKRPGLNDSIWADSPPSKGSPTRPSINKEVAGRVVNPQLTYSSRERRKKSIEIITEATKRRTAVLEKAAVDKEAALTNNPTNLESDEEL